MGFTMHVGGEELVVLPVPLELDGLTESERAVLLAALSGASTAEIARARSVSPKTVSNQLHSAYRKLGVCGRSEAAVMVLGRTP